MVFTSEPLLRKVARFIPVLSSRSIGKCAARVFKRSGHNTRGASCGLFPTHRNLKIGQRTFSHYRQGRSGDNQH